MFIIGFYGVYFKYNHLTWTQLEIYSRVQPNCGIEEMVVPGWKSRCISGDVACSRKAGAYITIRAFLID